jgi:hypothetical protein
MVLPFFFLAELNSAIAGLQEAKNLAGKLLRLIQICLPAPSLDKITPNCQAKKQGFNVRPSLVFASAALLVPLLIVPNLSRRRLLSSI